MTSILQLSVMMEGHHDREFFHSGARKGEKMMKMIRWKKWLAAVCAVVIGVGCLTGCGGAANGNSADGNAANGSSIDGSAADRNSADSSTADNDSAGNNSENSAEPSSGVENARGADDCLPVSE